MNCSVCLEKYSPGERAPLLLPCGHSFCRTCLITLRLTEAANLCCPSCKKPHRDLQLDQLPVVFDLLTVSPCSSTETVHDQCETHKDDLNYWCCDCTVALCGLCLNTSSHLDHMVLLAKKFLQDKKTELGSLVEEVRKEVKKQHKEVWANLTTVFDTSCGHLYQLEKISKDLTNLLTEIKQVTTIDKVLPYQSRLHHIKKQRQVYSETSIHGITTETTKPAEDCLFLLPIIFAADTRHHAELPSEVFLELSDGSRCLGRVYIRLWGHLSRARQLLALCLGSFGPSYTGAAAVKYEDDDREGLWFGHYIGDNKTQETRGLISDLECGGEHSKPAKEGLLVAGDGGGEEAQFTIITKVKQQYNAQCPFGEVTSGLEVVQAAVKNLARVTITNCGLPSEVFLELSDGSRCLGRVYIRLWGHLRRARQMFVLCQGSLGPSYTGAAAEKHENDDGEDLVFNHYIGDNKARETRALVNDLEWGGEHEKTVWEGHVAAYDRGQGKAQFTIITRVKRQWAAYCPFGQVTSGLEVVQAAVNLDTEVTITNCGVRPA